MFLALFDIDGTLISTHGAGMRAFYRALDSVFHVQAGDGAVRPDGKTDPLILKELLAGFGLEDRFSDETRDALFSTYLGCLDDEMSRARDEGRIRVLPGARELLERLSGESDFCIGLVTGNLEKGACIKIRNAELDGFFRFGGYGSDSENRTELTRAGIQRGARLVAPSPVEGAFVIGDTPLDIEHGRAAGALTIAVASAKYGMEELASHRPDLLVWDLTPAQEIIDFMRRNGSSAAVDTSACL